MQESNTPPLIAIACGGTGGHLFPGLAIAEILLDSGCDVALLISPKQVDQEAARGADGLKIITLPAVALQGGAIGGFLRGAWRSYGLCRREFRERPPRAVLAMGGFTSAPPVIAGKRSGAATFLHEANAIPGRANRWLAPWVDEAFLTFPTAAARLSAPRTTVTGMPVRPQFKPADAGACRMALGLSPDQPVLCITGGSQGASGVNELALGAVPGICQRVPGLQILHLTGARDCERVRAGYAAHKVRAQVFPFLTEMELALGAATLVISRAGASSLAEIAAMRRPAILIPYPSAADNHQFHNAQAVVELGAARQLDQAGATPEKLLEMVVTLLADAAVRDAMSAALERWHIPNAAEQIATRLLKVVGAPEKLAAREPEPGASEKAMPDRRTYRGEDGSRLDWRTQATA